MSHETERAAWIELPRSDSPQVRPPAGHPYDFGFVTNMGRLLAAHPRFGPLFRKLFAEIMFAEGRLDRSEREMVAAVAAAAQDCHY